MRIQSALLLLGLILVAVQAAEARRRWRGYRRASTSCSGKCDVGYVPGNPCQCNSGCQSHNNCCSDYQPACLSCQGRCGMHFNNGLPCQCNADCVNHGNCCSDYTKVCLSCHGRCNDPFNSQFACQCNSSCENKNDCCIDYDVVCHGGNPGDSTPKPPVDGQVSDKELIELSETLIKLDANNVADMIKVDFGGRTSQCSGQDKAPNPFFVEVDDAMWNVPTINLLRKLFDNYKPSVTNVEDHTPNERVEEHAFLDAVMDTQVMNVTHNFLYRRGFASKSIDDFKQEIYDIWFQPYDRHRRSGARVIGSSGFEHVFMGELKNGDVSGFHGWLHFLYLEQRGDINYLGELSETTFGDRGYGVTNVFDWNGTRKCIGSMFAGTSPELDLAVLTTCFMTRLEKKCRMEYEGKGFRITTYPFNYGGKVRVGTAYPDFE